MIIEEEDRTLVWNNEAMDPVACNFMQTILEINAKLTETTNLIALMNQRILNGAIILDESEEGEEIPSLDQDD